MAMWIAINIWICPSILTSEEDCFSILLCRPLYNQNNNKNTLRKNLSNKIMTICDVLLFDVEIKKKYPC
jgi:hypothetical protein